MNNGMEWRAGSGAWSGGASGDGLEGDEKRLLLFDSLKVLAVWNRRNFNFGTLLKVKVLLLSMIVLDGVFISKLTKSFPFL
jgi:hypothetical protein